MCLGDVMRLRIRVICSGTVSPPPGMGATTHRTPRRSIPATNQAPQVHTPLIEPSIDPGLTKGLLGDIRDASHSVAVKLRLKHVFGRGRGHPRLAISLDEDTPSTRRKGMCRARPLATLRVLSALANTHVISYPQVMSSRNRANRDSRQQNHRAGYRRPICKGPWGRRSR